MNTLTSKSEQLDLAQALVKGMCPICSVLLHFQNNLAERLLPNGTDHLCNYHAWLAAKLAPAEIAAVTFRRMLQSQFADSSALPYECDMCRQVRQEEQLQLRELTTLLTRKTVLEWMRQQGGICFRHATQLRDKLPIRLQTILSEILARTVRELDQELGAFHEKRQRGDRSGYGALGRAAEVLVSQRGVLT
jgi:hypothetical protein